MESEYQSKNIKQWYKRVILVVCDRLSKMAHFVATTERTSAEELARLFRDNV